MDKRIWVAHYAEGVPAEADVHVKQVEFRTQLPKTAIGKVLRRSLREGAAEAV